MSDVTVERENWRVHVPRMIRVPLALLAIVALRGALWLVDLSDPRNP